MEVKVYTGNSDVIRDGSYQWRIMENDELIINKQYEILRSHCMQQTYKLVDGEIVEDKSNERYLYHWVLNERGNRICVWEEFFK